MRPFNYGESSQLRRFKPVETEWCWDSCKAGQATRLGPLPLTGCSFGTLARIGDPPGLRHRPVREQSYRNIESQGPEASVPTKYDCSEHLHGSHPARAANGPNLCQSTIPYPMSQTMGDQSLIPLALSNRGQTGIQPLEGSTIGNSTQATQQQPSIDGPGSESAINKSHANFGSTASQLRLNEPVQTPQQQTDFSHYQNFQGAYRARGSNYNRQPRRGGWQHEQNRKRFQRPDVTAKVAGGQNNRNALMKVVQGDLQYMGRGPSASPNEDGPGFKATHDRFPKRLNSPRRGRWQRPAPPPIPIDCGSGWENPFNPEDAGKSVWQQLDYATNQAQFGSGASHTNSTDLSRPQPEIPTPCQHMHMLDATEMGGGYCPDCSTGNALSTKPLIWT